MFLLSVRPRFPVFPCSTTRRGCNVSDLEQVVSVFNRRIFLCLALGTMKWYVRTCLDSLWWCMFIQRAVCWGFDSRVAPTFILFVWLCWRLEATDGRQPRPPVSFTFILTPSIPPPTFTVISPCVCICERGCVCGQFGPPRCLFVFPLECGWCAVSPAKRGDSGWGDTKRTLEIKADRRRERRDRKEYLHGVIPAHLALDA